MEAVKTRVRRAGPASIHEAAGILRAGGLVVFPTETVYGLGARAFDPSATRRVYRAKGRPLDNPLIVHVSDEKQLARVALRVTPLARRLMDAFWPGPLTLILDKAPGVPAAVTAGQGTVAVRMPKHPAALALLRELGEPLAAPSANRSGRPSPTTAAHALRDLEGRVPLILDGGACRKGLESSIVDARLERPVLLRPGTITPAAIEKAAGARLAAPGRGSPACPGSRRRHYTPSCRVILVSAAQVASGALPRLQRPGAGLIHRTRRSRPWPAFARRIPGGTKDYARRLFSALREAESAGVRTLYVETVSQRGVGLAIMDRLRRASA